MPYYLKGEGERVPGRCPSIYSLPRDCNEANSWSNLLNNPGRTEEGTNKKQIFVVSRILAKVR